MCNHEKISFLLHPCARKTTETTIKLKNIPFILKLMIKNVKMNLT